MGGFLMVGLIVVIIAGIANIFLQIPAVYLAGTKCCNRYDYVWFNFVRY